MKPKGSTLLEEPFDRKSKKVVSSLHYNNCLHSVTDLISSNAS